MKKIAFLGIGNMGNPMALNLKKAGFEVRAFDVSESAKTAGLQAGLNVLDNVASCVTDAEAIISMLPASQYVEDLYLGEQGLLRKAPKGALLIDCSTIAAKSSQKVAEAAEAAGFSMVDAPVSGGTAGAAGGTLTFMVGGDKAVLEKARPLLEAMGKKIFHAGPSGSGQIAKICNNMLLAIHMIGSSEALALGHANGMDTSVLSEILLQSSGRNWSLELYNPWPGVQEGVPASRNYQGGFAVDLMAKDLSLSQEAALASNTSTPLGALARNLYRMHSQSGNGRLDFSSILNLVKDN